MTWVWWVLGSALGLWALDRIARWAERRGWLYWRHGRGTGGTGAALGEVLEIFQPSRRHVVEEQERQRLTIAQAESGEPPLGVDLDAGTAVVSEGPTPGHPPSDESSTLRTARDADAHGGSAECCPGTGE